MENLSNILFIIFVVQDKQANGHHNGDAFPLHVETLVIKRWIKCWEAPNPRHHEMQPEWHTL